MRIRYNRRFSEHIPHDKVRTLSPDTRQLEQLLEILRHPSAVLIPQLFHAGADVSRLALAKTAGMDNLFDVVNRCLRQRIDIGEFLVELLYDHIYPRVRTLRRKPHTHQQLPRLVILQTTAGLRVLLL